MSIRPCAVTKQPRPCTLLHPLTATRTAPLADCRHCTAAGRAGRRLQADRQTRSFAGYIEGEWLYLAAPLGGYLDTLPVARGSRVAASAPVFSVEAVPEQQGLREAEARADSARQEVRKPQRAAPPERSGRHRSPVARRTGRTGLVHAAGGTGTRHWPLRSLCQTPVWTKPAPRKPVMRRRLKRCARNWPPPASRWGREPEVRAAQAEAEAAVAQVAQKKWQVDRKLVTSAAGTAK
jgi:HlyD family secretion protein